MATSGKATLHGLFSLQEDATLETFLPALEAYLRHLQAVGYVLRWRVEQQKVLGISTAVSQISRILSQSNSPISTTTKRAISTLADGRNRSIALHWPCTSRSSRCTVFPHLRTSPAVNIGPGQVSCCGGAGPQAGQCQRAKGETPASLHGQGHCAA